MPRKRIREDNVYEFDELSDRAKAHARDWYRECASSDVSDYQAESVLEDAARLGEMIGLNIRTRLAKLMGGGTRMEPQVYYSGFSSQGDGASYVGSYAYKAGGVKALASEAPCGTDKGHEGNNEVNRIARELQAVQRNHFYRIQANVSAGRGRYSHSHTMDIDVDRADSVDMSDDDIETVKDLLRDFADWIYRSLEREYEYQNSDEVIDENIRANEYEFTEEGDRA